jgi:hypothetical protein
VETVVFLSVVGCHNDGNWWFSYCGNTCFSGCRARKVLSFWMPSAEIVVFLAADRGNSRLSGRQQRKIVVFLAANRGKKVSFFLQMASTRAGQKMLGPQLSQKWSDLGQLDLFGNGTSNASFFH